MIILGETKGNGKKSVALSELKYLKENISCGTKNIKNIQIERERNDRKTLSLKINWLKRQKYERNLWSTINYVRYILMYHVFVESPHTIKEFASIMFNENSSNTIAGKSKIKMLSKLSVRNKCNYNTTTKYISIQYHHANILIMYLIL